jgi:hypothetical protein
LNFKCPIKECNDSNLFTKEDVKNHLVWHGLQIEEAEKKVKKIK